MASFQTMVEDRARAAGDFVVVVTRDRLVRGSRVARDGPCEIRNRPRQVSGTRRAAIGENQPVTLPRRPARARGLLLAAALVCGVGPLVPTTSAAATPA